MAEKKTSPPVRSMIPGRTTPLPLEFAFDKVFADFGVIASGEYTDKNKRIRMMATWNQNLKGLERSYPPGSLERAYIKSIRDSVSLSTIEDLSMEDCWRLFDIICQVFKKGEK